MDLYQFVVDDFVIHDTRALHNDTLSLSYSAYVDGDMVKHILLSLGDFDNGDYRPKDSGDPDQAEGLRFMINDPTARVAFISSSSMQVISRQIS